MTTTRRTRRPVHAVSIDVYTAPPSDLPAWDPDYSFRLFSINTTSASSADAELTAIEELSASWSRPTPRDSPDAGTTQLVLRYPTQPPIYAGYWVTVGVQLDPGGAVVPVAAGPVESVTYARSNHRRGIWRAVVQCIDTLGYAEQARLAATPWPVHTTIPARLAAIAAAGPPGMLDLDAVPAGGWPDATSAPLAPRDVDNAPALDVIRRTVAGYLLVADNGPSGVTVAGRPGPHITWTPAVQIVRGDPVTTLPARAVRDMPRSISRRGGLNSATIRYQRHDDAGELVEDETSYRYLTRRTESGYRIDTDQLRTAGQTTELDAWLTDTMALSAGQAPMLDGTADVLTRDLTAATLAPLIDSTRRGHAVVLLDRADPDIEPGQAITSGRLAIRAGHLSLTIGMQPARLAGYHALTWGEIPPAVQFDDLAGVPLTLTESRQIGTV